MCPLPLKGEDKETEKEEETQEREEVEERDILLRGGLGSRGQPSNGGWKENQKQE